MSGAACVMPDRGQSASILMRSQCLTGPRVMSGVPAKRTGTWVILVARGRSRTAKLLRAARVSGAVQGSRTGFSAQMADDGQIRAFSGLCCMFVVCVHPWVHPAHACVVAGRLAAVSSCCGGGWRRERRRRAARKAYTSGAGHPFTEISGDTCGQLNIQR